MVEFDTPAVLLSNSQSYFASLVEQTGVAESEHLRTLANASKLSTKRRHEICIADEQSEAEMNETDPLVPSSSSL